MHNRYITTLGVVLIVSSGFFVPGSSTQTPQTKHEATPSSASINLLNLKPVGKPTVAEKRAVFNRVWKLFSVHYPSFSFKVVNWKKEKTIYEPKALRANTWSKFFGEINEMILTLHDYHSGLVNAPSTPYYSPAILTQYVDNQLVVVAAPQASKIRPGMVVLGTNGVSINNFMDGIGVPSTQVPDFFRPLGFQIRDVFLENSDRPEEITVYNPKSGNVLSETLPVYDHSHLQAIWNHFAKQHPVVMSQFGNSPAFNIRSLGGGITYLKISSMDSNLWQQLESHMNEIVHSKGLIIDLRNNGGGNSAPGSWFAQHFYSKPTTALERRPSANVPWIPEILQPLLPRISVPTAVLINGEDWSSAEMFIAQLEAAPNVETFGSRTMGADGNPVFYPVMNGVEVKISSWQERVTSTGLPIEQFGITPEKEVQESYTNFLKELSLSYDNKGSAQYDDVLQKANVWVRSKIQSSD
ncbi:S41 family peptidase [Alicyclobacillus tolerans]|uniref:S41 family peptidase n=1 Tax=Alicyclobacillus tolerans TaxID=90970 RepID=UPI003B9802B2